MNCDLLPARLFVGLAFLAVSAITGAARAALAEGGEPPRAPPDCISACASLFGLLALCAAGAYAAYAIARPRNCGAPAEAEEEGPCSCVAPRRFYLLPVEGARDLYPPQTGDQYRRGDTGVDLRWPADIRLEPGEKRLVKLGVRAAHLCEGCETASAFWLAPRSSIGKTDLQLANSLGLIDRGYRGEICAMVRNLGAGPYAGKRGDALFQLAAADLSPARYTVCVAGGAYEARLFSEGATARGEGGFGSTGAAGR